MIGEMTTPTPAHSNPPRLHNGTRHPRRRLPVAILVEFLGAEKTVQLCRMFGNQRLPSFDQLLRWMRQQSVIADYLNHAYTQPALASKYQLSLASVKKIITAHLTRQRVAERDERRRENGLRV